MRCMSPLKVWSAVFLKNPLLRRMPGAQCFLRIYIYICGTVVRFDEEAFDDDATPLELRTQCLIVCFFQLLE